jgi:hypothetical protein
LVSSVFVVVVLASGVVAGGVVVVDVASAGGVVVVEASGAGAGAGAGGVTSGAGAGVVVVVVVDDVSSFLPQAVSEMANNDATSRVFFINPSLEIECAWTLYVPSNTDNVEAPEPSGAADFACGRCIDSMQRRAGLDGRRRERRLRFQPARFRRGRPHQACDDADDGTPSGPPGRDARLAAGLQEPMLADDRTNHLHRPDRSERVPTRRSPSL